MIEFSFDCPECGDEILYEVSSYEILYEVRSYDLTSSVNDLDAEVTCEGCGETFDAHLSYSY